MLLSVDGQIAYFFSIKRPFLEIQNTDEKFPFFLSAVDGHFFILCNFSMRSEHFLELHFEGSIYSFNTKLFVCEKASLEIKILYLV